MYDGMIEAYSVKVPNAAGMRSMPKRTRGPYAQIGKRVFDVVFVLLVAPIILPIVGILAVIIGLDGGAAFYGHERVGRNGQRFTCWKLRSMVADADARLVQHLAENPEARMEWDREFKLQNDPRVTRLGRFLRRTSLDELPQFLNVLSGEMSVVGPRPVTAPEIECYGAQAASVLNVRPGVTGLWQVSGRNAVSYPDRVALDIAYVTKLSFVSDLFIVFKTVKSVLVRTGC
ncbi:sugar transferase [Celeribacter arenosi]|uniref:Bacterial sugar transferase domain-containing protein n=1 Tax=Celeribacter arenosi TaxID=792649 RepID=A0ABP7JRR3_9RHOB